MAVLGLGRSGRAACRWLVDHGLRVYASDSGSDAHLAAAADAVRQMGASAQVGGHDLARIGRAAAVVVSPGIPPTAPPLQAAQAANVAVVGELELAVRAVGNDRLIVVTGTNGKTTTTGLIAHVLSAAGRTVCAAGNIGTPLIGLADTSPSPEWFVVEASSFQLHTADSLSPVIGVLTNLAPDHLDRYERLADYYADKARLFANATDESHWLVNGDDPAAQTMVRAVPGRIERWRVGDRADAWLDPGDQTLKFEDEPLMPRREFPLLGDHNVANALAAALVGRAVGVNNSDIRRGLGTASAAPHRLEVIATTDGIRWINDSKATNVAAARAALRAMDRPFVLIAGGKNKGDDLSLLGPEIDERCRAVVAYGTAGDELVAALTGVVNVVRLSRFDEAVACARDRAAPGEAILLAPACASFDQFDDYEARGDAFRALATS